MSNSVAWKEGVEGVGRNVEEEDEVIWIYAYHFSSFKKAFFERHLEIYGNP